MCVPGSPGLRMLTVAIFLAWVGNQPTVVWARGHQVWDTIVVIVIITFIANSILISVQLGTINNGGAVVCAVLVAIPITAEENYSLVETEASAPGEESGWAVSRLGLSDPIRPFFDKAASETSTLLLQSPERSQPLPV